MSMDFSEIDKRVASLESQWTLARAQYKAEGAAVAQAEEALQDALEAQALIQDVAQGVQQQAHQRITQIVSRCLAAVFDDPYEFKIHFTQKRGKTEAEIVFVRRGNELRPTDGAGLGTVDIAAFGLRAAALCLSRPQRRRLLVMDEPFKHLRQNYDRVALMIETLAEELGIQFVLINQKEIEIGKVYRL